MDRNTSVIIMSNKISSRGSPVKRTRKIKKLTPIERKSPVFILPKKTSSEVQENSANLSRIPKPIQNQDEKSLKSNSSPVVLSSENDAASVTSDKKDLNSHIFILPPPIINNENYSAKPTSDNLTNGEKMLMNSNGKVFILPKISSYLTQENSASHTRLSEATGINDEKTLNSNISPVIFLPENTSSVAQENPARITKISEKKEELMYRNSRVIILPPLPIHDKNSSAKSISDDLLNSEKTLINSNANVIILPKTSSSLTQENSLSFTRVSGATGIKDEKALKSNISPVILLPENTSSVAQENSARLIQNSDILSSDKNEALMNRKSHVIILPPPPITAENSSAKSTSDDGKQTLISSNSNVFILPKISSSLTQENSMSLSRLSEVIPINGKAQINDDPSLSLFSKTKSSEFQENSTRCIRTLDLVRDTKEPTISHNSDACIWPINSSSLDPIQKEKGSLMNGQPPVIILTKTTSSESQLNSAKCVRTVDIRRNKRKRKANNSSSVIPEKSMKLRRADAPRTLNIHRTPTFILPKNTPLIAQENCTTLPPISDAVLQDIAVQKESSVPLQIQNVAASVVAASGNGEPPSDPDPPFISSDSTPLPADDTPDEGKPNIPPGISLLNPEELKSSAPNDLTSEMVKAGLVVTSGEEVKPSSSVRGTKEELEVPYQNETSDSNSQLISSDPIPSQPEPSYLTSEMATNDLVVAGSEEVKPSSSTRGTKEELEVPYQNETSDSNSQLISSDPIPSQPEPSYLTSEMVTNDLVVTGNEEVKPSSSTRGTKEELEVPWQNEASDSNSQLISSDPIPTQSEPSYLTSEMNTTDLVVTGNEEVKPSSSIRGTKEELEVPWQNETSDSNSLRISSDLIPSQPEPSYLSSEMVTTDLIVTGNEKVKPSLSVVGTNEELEVYDPNETSDSNSQLISSDLLPSEPETYEISDEDPSPDDEGPSLPNDEEAQNIPPSVVPTRHLANQLKSPHPTEDLTSKGHPPDITVTDNEVPASIALKLHSSLSPPILSNVSARQQLIINRVHKKVSALRLVSEGQLSLQDVCSLLKCNLDSLKNWMSERDVLMDRYNQMVRQEVPDSLDERLYSWYKSAVEKCGRRVDYRAISKAARRIYKKLNGIDNFKPNLRWVASWRRRFKLPPRPPTKPKPEAESKLEPTSKPKLKSKPEPSSKPKLKSKPEVDSKPKRKPKDQLKKRKRTNTTKQDVVETGNPSARSSEESDPPSRIRNIFSSNTSAKSASNQSALQEEKSERRRHSFSDEDSDVDSSNIFTRAVDISNKKQPPTATSQATLPNAAPANPQYSVSTTLNLRQLPQQTLGQYVIRLKQSSSIQKTGPGSQVPTTLDSNRIPSLGRLQPLQDEPSEKRLRTEKDPLSSNRQIWIKPDITIKSEILEEENFDIPIDENVISTQEVDPLIPKDEPGSPSSSDSNSHLASSFNIVNQKSVSINLATQSSASIHLVSQSTQTEKDDDQSFLDELLPLMKQLTTADKSMMKAQIQQLFKWKLKAKTT